MDIKHFHRALFSHTITIRGLFWAATRWTRANFPKRKHTSVGILKESTSRDISPQGNTTLNEIMNDAKLHEWLRSVYQFNTTDRLREEAESWNF